MVISVVPTLFRLLGSYRVNESWHYTASEWLINNAAAVSRRGLIGELLLGVPIVDDRTALVAMITLLTVAVSVGLRCWWLGREAHQLAVAFGVLAAARGPRIEHPAGDFSRIAHRNDRLPTTPGVGLPPDSPGGSAGHCAVVESPELAGDCIARNCRIDGVRVHTRGLCADHERGGRLSPAVAPPNPPALWQRWPGSPWLREHSVPTILLLIAPIGVCLGFIMAPALQMGDDLRAIWFAVDPTTREWVRDKR